MSIGLGRGMTAVIGAALPMLRSDISPEFKLDAVHADCPLMSLVGRAAFSAIKSTSVR